MPTSLVAPAQPRIRTTRQVVAGRSYEVAVYLEPHAGWLAVEEELRARGRPLPLCHRLAWTGVGDARNSWFVAVRDDEGSAVCGFAVQLYPSRALPGHSILRAERMGECAPPEALHAGVLAVRALARAHAALRLEVELFVPDAAVRARMGEALAAAGFQPRPLRLYRDTLAVDLRPDEAGIFASLHATARRHVRAVAKHPVEVREVVEPAYAERMNDLLRETMERTGGEFQPTDWRRMIAFCAANPELARLTGLVRTDVQGPEALVAYALGLNHGTHAEYSVAASTRSTPLRIPMAYALAWELMRWGKGVGATWFDFGGVTPGEHGTGEDPTGGISDFKRYFTRDVVRVGELWSHEPHPIRAVLARGASSAAGWLRARR